MRRFDSGWRDARLPLVHSTIDVAVPAAGMTLPMVEYDRGEAVAIVNYIRRDLPLGKGPDIGKAYVALGALRSPIGARLPFFTVRYDPRNWAMQLFAHNDCARDLLGTSGWLPSTELHFARLLYRLRGRVLPELSGYGVEFSEASWLDYEGVMAETGWPGQDMSVRRRAYEPEGAGVTFGMRLPCADIDLAVVGRTGAVNLLVDYKLCNAYVDPEHATHKAMSNIRGDSGARVPSMIVRYDPAGDRWSFAVFCLNEPARDLLGAVSYRRDESWFTEPNGWLNLGEDYWFDVVRQARDS